VLSSRDAETVEVTQPFLHASVKFEGLGAIVGTVSHERWITASPKLVSRRAPGGHDEPVS
jgi:hypothetical protein